MGLLEITLIMIGIFIVITTFVVTDKLWGQEKKENADIEAHKEDLKAEMTRIFEEQAADAQAGFESAVAAKIEEYAEEKRRSLEVLVNEAKEAMKAAAEDADEKMHAYVMQLQEDGKVISQETKEAMEVMLEKNSNALNERSEQMIAEINHHHNDVTFLYSMINDKEEEVKQHVKLVEELQTSVRMVEHEVKNVQLQVNAITQTTKAARSEFVKEIAEGVIAEVSSPKFCSALEMVSEETETETLESTRTFDRDEVEEMLNAIGQSVEEVVVEDAMDLSFDAPVGDVTDELFAEPETVEEEAEEESESEAEAAETDQEEAVEEENKDEEAVEEENKEEVVEETAEGESEKEEEAIVEEETQAEETVGEAVEEETEIEEKSEETAEASAEKSAEEPVQNSESIVETVAEDVVNALIAEMPVKLIKAVEKSRTLSSEADMATRVKVLEMYDKGFSSMEIAEEYKLGIGEVRMIIDLYSRSER